MINGINYINKLSKNSLHKAVIHMTVCVGSLQDCPLYGVAHFLEHMLIKPFDKPDLSYTMHGTTEFSKTTFCIECIDDSASIIYSVKAMNKIISGELLNPQYLESVRSDIIMEFEAKPNNMQSVALFEELFKPTKCSLPIGTLTMINNIQFSDVVKFHAKWYQRSPLCVNVFSSTEENTLNIKANTEKHKLLKNFKIPILNCNANYLTTQIIHFNNTILITVKRAIHITVMEQVLDDLCLYVLEILFTEFFHKLNVADVNVQCSYVRYDKMNSFNLISLDGLSPTFIINADFLKKLYKFVKRNLSCSMLSDICKSQQEGLKDITDLELSDFWSDCFAYEEPVISLDEYNAAYSKIIIKDVLSTISIWLNSGCI